MQTPLPAIRLVRGATSGTISFQATDGDGEPSAPAGTVTVTVTRSDGTALYTDAATSGATTNPRTLALSAADLAVVDRLTAVWTDNAVEVHTDEIDVSGTVVSVARIKTLQNTLTNDTTATLTQARRNAEDRFVATQTRSPFQRFHVERLNGTGRTWLWASFPDLVEVRWARIYTSATAYTALTVAELAAINVPDRLSKFERTDGLCWPVGRANIEVGYVFGMRSVPHDLERAFGYAIRKEVTDANTSIPDEAANWGSVDGINFGIPTPGQRGAIYGLKTVDDVWNKYRDPRPMIA